jgi:nucleotide-binding universal stress UspA family protein
MFKNILLAVDGSAHALHAAKMAGQLARETEGDLRVVIAFDPVPAYLGEPNFQQAINNRLAEAQTALEAALKEIGKIPGTLQHELIEGTPAEAILAVAETRGNDLIIMGSRGLGQLTGALLGSQSQKVVHHAHCPVLIVR